MGDCIVVPCLSIILFEDSWDSAQEMRGKAMFDSQVESEDETESQTRKKSVPVRFRPTSDDDDEGKIRLSYLLLLYK